MSATEDFAELKFRIECSDMVLTKDGGSPLVVRGPGEIWQDEAGVLQFKIFITNESYHRLQTYMERPGVVGQLIPDEDYFTLEASPHSHPTWTARRVLPSTRGGLSKGMAYGHLTELVHAETYPVNPESEFVTLRLKEKLEFPCNKGTETVIRVGGQDRHASNSLNAAFFEDAKFKFEIFHEHEHTFISLQLPSGQLTTSTPARIREAFQFVLGRQIAVMVIETSSGGQNQTRLTSPSRGSGRMPPPLMFDRLDRGGHVWRMFTNYFRHIHAYAEPGWHPISRHVGSAIESTAASLGAEVLALAVAVEGLVGECFPNLAPVAPEFLTELTAVQTALASVQVAETTRNRINGSINAMRRARNSDLLRAFITTNRLPVGLFDSWSLLRNTSAHGGGAGGRDIETILRLKSEVLSLLYSIVFAAINYKGPRTDYSMTGWPRGIWPVPPVPDA